MLYFFGGNGIKIWVESYDIGILNFVMENKSFSLKHPGRPNWQCEAIGLLRF